MRDIRQAAPSDTRVAEPGARAHDSTDVQQVQFQWEEQPYPRAVRLVNGSRQVGDPVRVTLAGIELEGRIEAVEPSRLLVRIGPRLF